MKKLIVKSHLTILVGIWLLIPQSSYTQAQVDSLIREVHKYFYNDIAKADSFAKEALQLAKAEKDSLKIAKSLKALGSVEYQKHDYSSAVNSFLTAIDYFSELDEPQQEAFARNNLALVYKELGLYQQAVNLYMDNLRYFDREGDSLRIFQTYNNMGIIFEKLYEYENALKYYNRALDFNPRDTFTLANLCMNKGLLFSIMDQRDSAKFYYEKAASIFEELDAKSEIANIYENLSSFYADEGKFELALDYVKRSTAIKEELGILDFYTYSSWASVYLKMKDDEKALPYLLKAYELVKDANQPRELFNVTGSLEELYARRGDFEKAYYYSGEEEVLMSSLYFAERAKAIKRLEVEFQTEQQQQRIALLNSQLEAEQKDRELVEKEKDLQRLYKNIALAGGALAILFVFLLVNRIRMRKRIYQQKEELLKQKNKVIEVERRQLEAELDHKNRELSAMALASAQKNDLLLQIEEQLKGLEQDQKAKPVKNIKKLIKEQSSIDEDWEQFKIHFESVHPDFYKKLLDVSTDLTQNDLKHCTYIKVKLASKEIARIMGISPKSVQMARYRLKKKLDLGAEEDLFVFMEQL